MAKNKCLKCKSPIKATNTCKNCGVGIGTNTLKDNWIAHPERVCSLQKHSISKGIVFGKSGEK